MSTEAEWFEDLMIDEADRADSYLLAIDYIGTPCFKDEDEGADNRKVRMQVFWCTMQWNLWQHEDSEY